MKQILMFVLCLPLYCMATAQSSAPIHISYAIEQEGMTGMNALLLNNASIDVYMSKGKNRISTLMGSGMIQTDSYTEKGHSPISLMKMMARKVKIVGIGTPKAQSATYKIQYDKSDKKNIQGYDCYKATITTNKGATAHLYVTEKIDIDLSDEPLFANMDFIDELKGFPLEVVSTTKNGTIHITTQSISHKVPDTTFQYDDTGYEETTWEELGMF